METELRKEEVEILNHIYREEHITQRRLAENLNISLGLVNLYIKKLTKKGLIKVKKLKNKQMLKYVLTPQGFKDRLKHNYILLKGSIDYFISVRDTILNKLNDKELGSKEIYIYGTDIWAEIIFLGVKNYGFNFVGFVADKEKIKEKLGYRVYSKEELLSRDKEFVLILDSNAKESGLKEEIKKISNKGTIIWL